MNIYIISSLSGPFGSIGKGWVSSGYIAERENANEAEVQDYFKSLLSTSMATDQPVSETAVADRAEKPIATPIKRKR